MYDIIIIGGGPAGLSAAIYGARGGFKTCMLEKTISGGQMGLTFEVENYPGTELMSGGELAYKFDKHARKFGAEIKTESVIECRVEGETKKIITSKGEYESRTVIFATGAKPRLLGIEGERELTGSGVSYCATCDGNFFKNKTVAVVGGGDTALEDAIFLSKLCEKVYLIHRRDSFRAAKRLTDRLADIKNVKTVLDSEVLKINGKMAVEGIEVRNRLTSETSVINVNGVFVAVGTVPQNEIVPSCVEKSDRGYVLTDEKMQTNIVGVYAAGDLREKQLRQIVTAAADGAVAAFNASLYIGEKTGDMR